MRPPWTDERVDQIIGQLLRTGLILSVAVVSIGAILYLIHHGGEHADFTNFRSEPEGLRSMAAIVYGAQRMPPPYHSTRTDPADCLTSCARGVFRICVRSPAGLDLFHGYLDCAGDSGFEHRRTRLNSLENPWGGL